MLPPVAEVFVVWHPDDIAGQSFANALVDHFHGTPFTGLIGGAVAVHTRSTAWLGPGTGPRPVPLPHSPLSHWLPGAHLVAVVPALGTEFAAALEPGHGPWHDYVQAIMDGYAAAPDRVGVYPLVLDRAVLDGTRASRLLGSFQSIGPAPVDPDTRSDVAWACRDLAQGMAQLATGDPDHRITVLISHTRRGETVEQAAQGQELVSIVREVLSQTRLTEFFDAHDLQPGQQWREALRSGAATNAMFVVRTDSYARSAWCQHEMRIGKQAGMAVVILDAVADRDERGSFLMDHVPRFPARHTSAGWHPEDVVNALNALVDECLKRELWRLQERLAAGRPELSVAWWAPHPPEPVTLGNWLTEARAPTGSIPAGPLRILHPGPPLGPDEVAVLDEYAAHAGVGPLEIMTPRSLAARVGWQGGEAPMTTLLPADALTGVQVGVSVSQSPDLGRLGQPEAELRLALGEITRSVVSAGGGLIYGGHLAPAGYTVFMLGELQRHARRDRPLLSCLAWHVHRRLPLDEISRFRNELGLYGRLVCLDPDGAEVDPAAGRGNEPEPVSDPQICERSLDALRRYMRDRQHGRVFIGGRRDNDRGRSPGVLEEALLALEAGQPCYLAGGFGGVTMDMVRALGLDDTGTLPAPDPPPAPAVAARLARLTELARDLDWTGLDNGLTEEENRTLAITYRAHEVASLVSRGLGRLAQHR